MRYTPQQLQIIELCKSGEWICHESLKKLMWNEHKRRGEIIKLKEYGFENRKCQHGIKRSFDYKMFKTSPIVIEAIEKAAEKIESPKLFTYKLDPKHTKTSFAEQLRNS